MRFAFLIFEILDDPVRQINENEKVGSVLFDPDGGDAFICGTDEDANDLLFMNLTDYNLGLYTERVPPTEWIVTIASQDISATAAGVVVTQGSTVGVLKTALGGAGTTTIVISAAPGVTFDTAANVVIGTGGAAVTVVKANLAAVTGTINRYCFNIKTNNVFNHEELNDEGIFTLKLNVIDSKNLTSEIVDLEVQVLDVNEPPVFTTTTRSIDLTYSKAGDSVGSVVQAIDPDVNGKYNQKSRRCEQM